MFSISRDFSFCYGHRLLNYEGKCRNLHGHNGLVRVTLSAGELNSTGMVRDFSELKEVLGGWIDENLDHRMILAENDPLLPILTATQTAVFPMKTNPTAEHLAELLFRVAADSGFPVQKVEFRETDKCRAVYEK